MKGSSALLFLLFFGIRFRPCWHQVGDKGAARVQWNSQVISEQASPLGDESKVSRAAGVRMRRVYVYTYIRVYTAVYGEDIYAYTVYTVYTGKAGMRVYGAFARGAESTLGGGRKGAKASTRATWSKSGIIATVWTFARF